jgi:hypothetical protein
VAAGKGSAAVAGAEPVRELPAAFHEHDARGLSWWVIGETLGGRLEAPRASVAAALLRLLHVLGPDPVSDEEAWQEVELRGRIMHGQPPRNPREWERVALLYDDEALEEFRRWEAELRGPLLEGDGRDADDPEVLRDRAAGERKVAGGIGDEDGS